MTKIKTTRSGGSRTRAAEGAQVIQYTNGNADNQLWTIEPQSDGYYLLLSKKSAKALAISGESLEKGARAVQWTKSTADHFKWRFDVQQ